MHSGDSFAIKFDTDQNSLYESFVDLLFSIIIFISRIDSES